MKGVVIMKNIITSIISCVKNMMKNYDEVYREIYKNPELMIMDGYSAVYTGYYL